MSLCCKGIRRARASVGRRHLRRRACRQQLIAGVGQREVALVLADPTRRAHHGARARCPGSGCGRRTAAGRRRCRRRPAPRGDLPAVVPTCICLTRPSTVTFCRHETAPIGIVPSARGRGCRRSSARVVGARRRRLTASAGSLAASRCRVSSRSIASTGSVVSNGTIVADTCGIRPTASAMRSAVRSCSSRSGDAAGRCAAAAAR